MKQQNILRYFPKFARSPPFLVLSAQIVQCEEMPRQWAALA